MFIASTNINNSFTPPSFILTCTEPEQKQVGTLGHIVCPGVLWSVDRPIIPHGLIGLPAQCGVRTYSPKGQTGTSLNVALMLIALFYDHCLCRQQYAPLMLSYI